MPKMIRVRSVQREGFNGYFCAQRFYPSDNWTEVSVLDEGVVAPMIEGRFDQIPNPAFLDQASYAALIADPRITIRDENDLELSEALATIKTLSAERDAAQASLKILGDERDAAQAQVADLQGKVDALTLALAQATAAASATKDGATSPTTETSPPSDTSAPPQAASGKRK